MTMAYEANEVHASRPPMEGERYANRVLERTFAILEALGRASKPLSLAEVALDTALDKATAFRLLTNLTRNNYVHKNASTKLYTLGYGMFKLARLELAVSHARLHARPFLESLAVESGLFAELGVVEGEKLRVIDTVTRFGRANPPFESGGFYEAHQSALGRAVLAYRTPAAVQSMYQGRVFSRTSDRSVQSAGSLQHELAATRARGYSTDYGERDRMFVSVAAALVPPASEPTLAIGVTGLTTQISRAATEYLGQKIERTAQQIVEFITGARSVSRQSQSV